MRAFFKLQFEFDPVRLANDLARLERGVWTDHYNSRDYSGTWNILPLRSVGGRTDIIHSVPGPDAYKDTAYLESCPSIREVIETFECPKTSIRLMRLAPGSVIKEHRDDVSHRKGEFRLHVPIQTNPEVQFILNGERAEMRPGECWFTDVSLPHSVANHGPDDRIHLVIDLVRNQWLEQQFEHAGQNMSSSETPEIEAETLNPETIKMAIAELERHDTPVANDLIHQLREKLKNTHGCQ